ncbi:methyl-accepting chemotaxis protein [Paenibacillus gansuensis]|uniref:Methyl-accepting chemotaxis protein n=1 Tax=Paenibacillus gansuensis TaxID=306542 RepID=A0ABW5PBV0_9BACL
MRNNKLGQASLKIFEPSVRLMNRMRYFQKFILISLVFLIPIGYMLFLFSSEIGKSLDTTKKEREGLAYSAGILKLFDEVRKHREAAALANAGSKDAESQLRALAPSVQASADRQTKMDAQYGAAFGTTETWQKVPVEWDVIQKSADDAASKPEEVYARHTSILQKLQLLLSQAKSASGLNRDPDADSFALMELTTGSLPVIIEQLEQAKARGTAVAKAGGEPDIREKTQLLLLKEQIAGTNDLVRLTLQNTNTANPALMNLLNANVQKYIQAMNVFSDTLDLKLLAMGGVKISGEDYGKAVAPAIDAAGALLQQTGAELEQLLSERSGDLVLKRNLLILSVVLILLIAFYLFTSFYISVSRVVTHLSHTSSELSQGNLTVRMPVLTKDEFAQVSEGFNRMIESFQVMMRMNKNTAEHVAASSEQLTATAQSSAASTEQILSAVRDAAKGAHAQLEASRENAIALGEMAAGIQRIAETSSTVSESALDGSREAKQGAESVHNAVKQMSVISETVGKASQVVADLGKSSKEVGKIVDVIADISKQTQLLSLNASIEAARAGEHGKGFAVVAGEVSKLADQTKQSAGRIHAMIQAMTQATQEAVASMQAGMKDVRDGMQLITETGRVFDRIQDRVELVAEQITEVSAATEELSAGTEQVTATMEGIVTICRQTEQQFSQVSAGAEEQSASLEKIASSAESLSDAAQEMRQAVSQFKL